MTIIDRATLLLTTQQALLGAITPEMRAVDVCWTDGEIRLRFIMDSENLAYMNELTNEVEAEIEGHFLPVARVTSVEVMMPAGTEIPPFDELPGGSARVFARCEEPY